MKNYVIVNGSPRKKGRCAAITKILTGLLESSGDSNIDVIEVGLYPASHCIACDGCKETYHCVLNDTLVTKYPLIDEADVLVAVSPIYFSGPSSQMKAFFDRMQQYYWDEERRAIKRHGHLFVVGEGGDPHGHEPAVTIARSSLAVAGFKLESVFDCIGVHGKDLDNVIVDAFESIKVR